jgi:hypothetical protein
MNKKLAIAAVVLLLIISSLGIYFLFKPDGSVHPKNSVTMEVVKSEQVGMTVKRGASLRQTTLTQADQRAGKLWEFAQPADSAQQFVINAFYEQGASLKKLTGYTKQSLRESVVANVNLQLPKQFPQYKELTQRDLTVNGIEANETIFEYVNGGVRIKQRLLLLFKNSETAIYIRGQAKADDYEEVNDRYFEALFKTATFDN